MLDDTESTEPVAAVEATAESNTKAGDTEDTTGETIHEVNAVYVSEHDVQDTAYDADVPGSEKGATVTDNLVPVPAKQKRRRSRMSNWLIVLLIAFAVLLSVAIGSLTNKAELSDEVQDKLTEIEKMKQDLARMQQQTEIMQRERDEAIAKAQQEEKMRAQDVKTALEAVNREKDAIAEAALAAETALKATREAEALAKKQLREDKRLREERKRLQQEKEKAKLEQQRLAQERRQAELERQQAELERARAEQLAREQRQAIAKQQAELTKATEQIEAEPAAAIKTDSKIEKKESSFITDPCSSPSARFLSTCR